ncbi:hypothetical protein ACP70R_028703 [Stipagrostis hirtigluma subsp. patula]
MAETYATPPSKRPRHGHAPPPLPEDVVVEQILTRVPPAAAVRFRAVCRAWRAALTSDHFVQAHRAARAAGQPPQIVFFAPAAVGSTAAAFYSFKLKSTAQQNGSSSDEASASASELVAVENAKDLALSGTKPCHGLTLLSELSASAYHVCNLSTGEHVALPPCARARGGEPLFGPFVFSSTGLGFDPAAGEHKVVRLYDDMEKQQRCEVYGIKSGGWRPCAGQAPMHAAMGLHGSPPVFLDGCFYWHINTRRNFTRQEDAVRFMTPEPILSLSIATEQFGWVRPPEERAQSVFNLAELDGALCLAVDARHTSQEYELWTRTTTAGDSPGSWSLRCRISLASLPAPVRDDMGRGIRMLPLGSAPGRKTTILLATSRHVVFAYDPESNAAQRVFSMHDFVDAPREVRPLLNIALHEESVTGVCRRRGHLTAAGDGGQLRMKLGSGTVARRGRLKAAES